VDGQKIQNVSIQLIAIKSNLRNRASYQGVNG